MQEAFQEWVAAVSEVRTVTSKYLNACTVLRTAASNCLTFPSNHTLVADILIQVQSHADSITCAEKSMRDSRSFLNQLRNESSVLVPIHQLPSELLARVFRHAEATTLCAASSPGQGALLDIMLVCSLWRRIAVNTRSLWSHVDIYSRPHRQSNGLPRELPKQARLRLERSLGLPIHIHVPYYPLQHAPVDEVIDLLHPHRNLIASVTVSGEHYRLFKALISLCVTAGVHGSLKAITAALIRPAYDDVYALDWSTLLFPGLVELSLTELRGSACPSPSALLVFLSRTPLLHTLRLKDLSPDVNQQPCSPVVLPRLKLLELSLSGSFLKLVSFNLRPGKLDLDVRLDLRLSEKDCLLPVQELLARSNIVSLTLQKTHPNSETVLSAYLNATPHLRALLLEIHDPEGFYILDDFVDWMLEDPVGRLSRLQALCIIEGRMYPGVMYKIQSVVSVTALKHLCFLECSFSPTFGGYTYSEESDEEIDEETYSSEMPTQARDWFTRWIKRVAVYAHRPSMIHEGEDEFIYSIIKIE